MQVGPANASSVERAVVSWSGGKDSCLALFEVQRSGSHGVEALLTTTTRDFERISMHGVRCALLERQAASLGLPLRRIDISKGAGNAEYERETQEVWRIYRERGVRTVIFGDLFLLDVKNYRDRMLAEAGMAGHYPLWKRDTSALIGEFLALGFKTVVVCVDLAQLDPSFVGRVIDEKFLADLPPNVDPCGENGEFHSFVFDGPNFSAPVDFRIGEIVCRDSFWFCDLLPSA